MSRAERRAEMREQQTRDGEYRGVVRKRGVLERIVVDATGTHRWTQHPKRKTEPHDDRAARARKARGRRRDVDRANDQWDVAYRVGTEDAEIFGRVTAPSIEKAKRVAVWRRPSVSRSFRILPYCRVA